MIGDVAIEMNLVISGPDMVIRELIPELSIKSISDRE